MILTETSTVTPRNGPRPVSKPTECFYCKTALGGEHTPDCVCRKRTVVLKATYKVCVEIPEHWTAEDVQWHYNESSSCADNLLHLLAGQVERMEKAETCMCGNQEVTLEREASAADHGVFCFVPEPKEKQ